MGELVDRDQEHLSLLKWGFYIMAGISGLMALFSLLYIGLGSIFAMGFIRAMKDSTTNSQQALGSAFLSLGLAFFLVGFATTLLTYFAARSVNERRRRTFCVIIAGLWCLWIPFGTAIGVCAILVLNRPSVAALFDGSGVPPPIPSTTTNET